MNLRADFVKRVEGAFGDRGRLFLRALPKLLVEAAQRWSLSDLRAAPGLSYNFIAFARRAGQGVVLKLGVPDAELTSEIHALRHFAGRGAARLLEADSGRGMLLLERLQPGTALTVIPDDADATHIAAQVMRNLRMPAPADSLLIQLSNWLRGFERLRMRLGGSTGPLERQIFTRAEALAAELLTENQSPMLIHGDLHHFNILRSGVGWKAIDPKGVVGPAAYEVGPFLLNPWVVAGPPCDISDLMWQRIEIFSEELQLEKECIWSWGLVHAVLSAIWSLEDSGDWRPAMECARVLDSLRLWARAPTRS